MASNGEPAGETKRCVRTTIYFNKKEGITDEEFHKYWSEVHGPLFANLPPTKEKLFKYNQYHNSLSMSKEVANFLGQPVLGFDAVAEFWAPDVESVLSIFASPDYQEVMYPDEAKFLTREGSRVMVGYDELHMDRS